jgi:hypothetical protein
MQEQDGSTATEGRDSIGLFHQRGLEGANGFKQFLHELQAWEEDVTAIGRNEGSAA